MKRQIEIDDTLQERVESAIENVKQELLNYLEENTPGKLPDLVNDLDHSGAIHEIVDGSVPIYTKEIEDTWYLYASELEEAYENAGCGENPRESNGAAAIYFYIQEKVGEWYQNEAKDIFEGWTDKLDTARDDGDHAGITDAEANRERGATANPYTQKGPREAWAEGYEGGYESTIQTD